jgi:hypothetical protein
MGRMRAISTPTISELRHEARSLHRLLRSYLDDRAFIYERTPTRLLYFVDAHEIKSYIDPNSPDSLVGFVLKAEQAVHLGEAAAVFNLSSRLRSDQLLHELLFDPSRQVGILPSHAEEVDEEIAFREDNWLRERLFLLDKARDEVRRLRDDPKTKRRLALAATQLNDPSTKRAVVDFFMKAAPALMALLRPNADDPQARISALVETSNLVRLGDLTWEEFGFDEVTCKRLRAVKPAPSEVERWRRYFRGRKERRKNSNRANRIDAEAVAFIQALNAALAPLPGSRLKARLVTRAMTLISGAGDREAVQKFGLREANFLRHTRLLALGNVAKGFVAQGGSGVNRRQDSQQLERALIIALQTYQRQLRSLGRDAIKTSDAEMRMAIAMLVRAWDEFEMARLTLDLRAGPDLSTSDDKIGDAELRKLIEWFRNDADVLTLLSEEVLKAVQQFGQATFALSQAGHPEPVLAQVIHLHSPERSRVLPMVAGSPGPVDLFAPALRSAPWRHSHLEGLLANLETNPAERYIAWALLFACQRRWEMARIYANSAVHIAKLLQGRDAERAAKEAILLRSQIFRLGADESCAKDGRRRFESSLAGLMQFDAASDPRIPRERAAQILELRLSVPSSEIPQAKLAFGFELLHTALDRCGKDDIIRSRILELGLSYHLAARDQPELWPEQTDADRTVAKQWHRQLSAILESQRRSLLPQEISRRARAMELIGFQLFVDANHSATEIGPAVQPLLIPPHLRLDVTELRGQIAQSIDATAQLIVRELEAIDRRLESFRVRDVIYAPVWATYDAGAILETISDERARVFAKSAYSDLIAIAGASQEVGVHSDHRGRLERIATGFRQALGVLQEAGDLATDERGQRACFYLRMEFCYARLLLAQLAPKPRRQQELTNLAAEYTAIVEDYPSASIPHFRLDTILSELDREDEATRAITRAVELIDNDSFLLPREHWVRSTVRRRIAMRFEHSAARQREELRAAPTDEKLRTQYLDNLMKAFQSVYLGFKSTDDADQDYLHRLEARRRINDVVYYGSCILSEDVNGKGLRSFGFELNELRDLLGRLHPHGIERLAEPDIVYTIGLGYTVLGQMREAAKAGKCLIALMAQRGDDPKDRLVANMLTNAFMWLRDHGSPEENGPISASERSTQTAQFGLSPDNTVSQVPS